MRHRSIARVSRVPSRPPEGVLDQPQQDRRMGMGSYHGLQLCSPESLRRSCCLARVCTVAVLAPAGQLAWPQQLELHGGNKSPGRRLCSPASLECRCCGAACLWHWASRAPATSLPPLCLGQTFPAPLECQLSKPRLRLPLRPAVHAWQTARRPQLTCQSWCLPNSSRGPSCLLQFTAAGQLESILQDGTGKACWPGPSQPQGGTQIQHLYKGAKRAGQLPAGTA